MSPEDYDVKTVRLSEDGKSVIVPLNDEQRCDLSSIKYTDGCIVIPIDSCLYRGKTLCDVIRKIKREPKNEALALEMIQKGGYHVHSHPDVENNTPLHVAALHGKEAIVGALTRVLPTQDLWKANIHGHTPLHMTRTLAVAKLLINGSGGYTDHLLFSRNVAQRTPLHAAIYTNPSKDDVDQPYKVEIEVIRFLYSLMPEEKLRHRDCVGNNIYETTMSLGNAEILSILASKPKLFMEFTRSYTDSKINFKS